MKESLNILDLILLLVALLSVVLGIVKGVIRELFSLAFFIMAVILSFLFYGDLGNILLRRIDSEEVAHFVAFAAIFTLVLVAGALVTFFVKKLFSIGPLKSVDRILGGFFGLLRGVLLAGILVFGLIAFQIHDKLTRESVLSPYVIKSVHVFINLLPGDIREKVGIFFNNTDG